jgi:hypothetical protein
VTSLGVEPTHSPTIHTCTQLVQLCLYASEQLRGGWGLLHGLLLYTAVAVYHRGSHRTASDHSASASRWSYVQKRAAWYAAVLAQSSFQPSQWLQDGSLKKGWQNEGCNEGYVWRCWHVLPEGFAHWKCQRGMDSVFDRVWLYDRLVIRAIAPQIQRGPDWELARAPRGDLLTGCASVAWTRSLIECCLVLGL